jgi:hypothetical protein
MNSRQSTLMACTALVGVWLFIPHAAQAQSASDSEKIQSLERQTELLQNQLKEIKDELVRTRRKNEPPATTAAYAADPPRAKAKAPAPEPKVKITVGGFIAAESVWRQRNEVADIGSSFTGIPYPFSPQFSENEFHGTARQSRISLLVEGNIDPFQKLTGYFETDFLGVGTTSNYNQSNSWAPRLRQAFLSYDNAGSGFHLLAGQAWSMETQNKVGIAPREENPPLTIDANYVVGFNYTRNWQVRLAQQFGAFTAGVSVENPATIFGGSTATAPLGLGGPFTSGSIVNGQVVNFSDTGGGGTFLTGVAVSTDTLPDVIEKLTFDPAPGWGHYEVFGIQRFFTDSILTCNPSPCIAGSSVNGTADSKTHSGSGIGGSILLPIIPKFLELTGNAMYGRGIGRYGAGQLPDVTIDADGSLSLLKERTAMIGLVAHPWEGTDIYAYAGMEQVYANYFTVGTNLFGYGNPGFSNVGCPATTATSFATTTNANPTNCIANNRRLENVTAGFWQNVYKGNYGRVTVGAEYSYIKRESFVGIGGAQPTYDNIVLTSLRYYPF